jgi:hypothetical protein
MSQKFSQLISNILQVNEKEPFLPNTHFLIEKQINITNSINNDISKAYEFANTINNSIPRFFRNFRKPPVISYLYKDNTLDKYFKSHPDFLDNLKLSCDYFLNTYNNNSFQNNFQICNYLISTIGNLSSIYNFQPKFEISNIFCNSFISNIVNSYNICEIVEFTKEFLPFFISLNPQVFNQIPYSSSLHLQESLFILSSNNFNILLGKLQPI